MFKVGIKRPREVFNAISCDSGASPHINDGAVQMTPWQAAAEGRAAHVNSSGILELFSRQENFGMSSYPHLTPKLGRRLEHVTNCRLYCRTEDRGDSEPVFRIMERTHQDNRPGAPVYHDRFFAVNEANGSVYTASVCLNPNVHQPKFPKFPKGRDTLIEDVPTKKAKLLITITALKEGEPRLSPLSMEREFGANGAL